MELGLIHKVNALPGDVPVAGAPTAVLLVLQPSCCLRYSL
jgi:hypothetical protein